MLAFFAALVLVAPAPPAAASVQAGTFRLDLKRPDGTAPENATIFVERPDGMFDWHAWSGTEDTFVFPAKTTKVRAYADLYRDQSPNSKSFMTGEPSRWVSQVLTLQMDEVGPEAIEVQLESRQSLDVTLKVPGESSAVREKYPFAWVLPAEDFKLEGLSSRLRFGKGVGFSFQLGANPKPPHAFVADVDLGEIVVIACDSFGHGAVWKKMTTVEGRNAVEIEVPDPEAAGRFTVEVKDADGHLMQAVRFSTLVVRKRSRRNSHLAPVKPAGGTYTFRWSEVDDAIRSKLIPGEDLDFDMTLIATVGFRNFASVPLVPGKDAYAIELPPPARATFVLRGESADQHWIQLRQRNGPFEQNLFVDDGATEVSAGEISSGSYVVRWIAKDDRNVQLKPMSGAPDTSVGRIMGLVRAERELLIRPGDQDIELVAPELRSIRLRLVSSGEPVRPTANLRIYRSGTDDSPRGVYARSKLVRASEQGEVAVGGIGLGPHTLDMGTWIKPVDFDVHGNSFSDEEQVHEIEIVEAKAALVSITEHGGELARAGLEHGDIIVGLDGQRFQGADDVKTCFLKAREDIVVLQVLRDAEELEIELELLPFDRNRGIGGSLRGYFGER